MTKKKHGFWEGHDEVTKEEVNAEGITIHTRYCKTCGEIFHEYAEKKEEKEYPIYMCTAPFGVLSRDFSASLQGSSSGILTFNSGNFHGSLNSKLEEVYIVKYLEGNLLKTKTFEAEDTDIIIDGRFCLTAPILISYDKVDGKWIERYRYVDNYELSLHLPELPKLGNNTTQKFQFLNGIYSSSNKGETKT
jgi:hypothetical protein